MKTPFIKAALCGLITALSVNYSAALSPADTSKTLVYVSTDKEEINKRVTREANVIYPNIFSGYEKESIAYVEKFSVARKAYLIRTFKRSKKFFPKAVSILKKHSVPAEFAVLLALESGFNANAVSGAGAVGYWQIMDEVAREYGLKIAEKENIATKKNKAVAKEKNAHKQIKARADDRKNFIKSTYVAARYLRDRSHNLNSDWLLIAASYNCGVGNVWNAMERSKEKNPDFWDIKNYLPAETRAYVMNFITLNVIFKNYENFAKNHLYFKQVTVDDVEKDEPATEADLSTNDY